MNNGGVYLYFYGKTNTFKQIRVSEYWAPTCPFQMEKGIGM